MSENPPAPPRMPPLPLESYSKEQNEAFGDFLATRGVGFSGPWHVFIRSPELLTHAQRMGAYLRYRCPLAGRLSELAILLVAREWTQDYEFSAHRKHGLEAGLANATVDAIADGRRPENLSSEEQLVWDFVTELLRTKRVSDPTYAKAVKLFGEQGTVDLAGIVGYYTLLAMTMNVARVPPSAGASRLTRFPE